MTNDDVIQMQKAGIPEDIILTKIGSSTADFRTGPQRIRLVIQYSQYKKFAADSKITFR